METFLPSFDSDHGHSSRCTYFRQACLPWRWSGCCHGTPIFWRIRYCTKHLIFSLFNLQSDNFNEKSKITGLFLKIVRTENIILISVYPTYALRKSAWTARGWPSGKFRLLGVFNGKRFREFQTYFPPKQDYFEKSAVNIRRKIVLS